MVATLVPLFDNKMNVSAYTVLAERDNKFLKPGAIGNAFLDGAQYVPGFDIVDTLGVESLSGDGDVSLCNNNPKSLARSSAKSAMST